MESTQANNNLFVRRSITKSRTPSVKWFKQWVAQDVVANGGKCFIMKWVTEATMKAMKEMAPKEPEEAEPEPEPEPTTEVLFLCSAKECGKTFTDAGALKKHAHVHGEKQHVCHYGNCGKKFLDSSKLKRHFLIHTGERHFVCPHEGCGKAFSLDFNLKSHMKTHSHENYHTCPYPDCGKKYAQEYKLKNHIMSHQKEQNMVDLPKHAQPPEKPPKTPQSTGGAHGAASPNRPHACPYKGCKKAYIHGYKLNLHLRREHPGHFPDENNPKNSPSNANIDMDDASDQEGAYGGKSGNGKVQQKQSKTKQNSKLLEQKVSSKSLANLNIAKEPWPVNEEMFEEEEDSEETEEDRDNVGNGWRYEENNDDDEETEYED